MDAVDGSYAALVEGSGHARYDWRNIHPNGRRMNRKTVLLPLAVLLLLASCQTAASGEAAEADQGLLHTSLGDFVVAGARFEQELHGAKPQEGEKLLLVVLERPGHVQLQPETFSLEEFQAMTRAYTENIFIRGEDGRKSYAVMAGWTEKAKDEFGLGFILREDFSEYVLIWPGNDPVVLRPEAQTARGCSDPTHPCPGG
jgi:hypothetical protein